MASSAPKLPIAPSSPPAPSSTAEPIASATPTASLPSSSEVSLVLVHVHQIIPSVRLFVHHVRLGDGLLEVLIPPRMRALLTRRTVGAEAGEVARAQLAADVLLAAGGAQRTEALVVVGAGRQLGLGVDVQIQTLVAVAAVAVADEEVALGHLAQVVLVQELAALALLAQRAQPVLAHQRVVARVGARRRVGRHVPVRARRPQRTVPRYEGFAYRSVGGKAVAVGRAQERREAEAVARRLVLEDLLRELGGSRRRLGRRHGGRGCNGLLCAMLFLPG